MHVDLLNFGYLPEEVLLVDGVARLIDLGELVFEEGPHLEHTQHLLLLEQESVIVGEKLDLKGIRELLDHLIVKEVQELRQETLLSLIYVDLVHRLLSFFVRLSSLDLIPFVLLSV